MKLLVSVSAASFTKAEVKSALKSTKGIVDVKAVDIMPFHPNINPTTGKPYNGKYAYSFAVGKKLFYATNVEASIGLYITDSRKRPISRQLCSISALAKALRDLCK